MSVYEYIGRFRREMQKFEDYGYAESLRITEEIRLNRQAAIKAEVILIDSSALHIKEYFDARYKITRLSYAYHYQDVDGGLIFRYDNAVHRPALGFREHKHTKDGGIREASLPDISDIIDEIIGYL